MLTITTPTGQVGSQLLAELLAAGPDPVRVIARDPSGLPGSVREQVEVIAGRHDDPATLDRALDGAQGLFWLVPPDVTAASAREHYLAFTRPAVAAIRAHRVGHVVAVSSAGRGWSGDAGVLSAAFAMDAELEGSGAAYRSLGTPFYMENLLGQLPRMTSQGVFSLPVSPDRPLPTIATRDIATTASGLLTNRGWEGVDTLPTFGPDHLTPVQMADVIAEVLDTPVSFEQGDLDQLAALMHDRGASPGMTHDFVKMSRAQQDGIYDTDWSRVSPTPTSFREWCEAVLAPAAAAAPTAG